MTTIRPCPLPPDALTNRYRAAGAYTDCYFVQVTGPVSLAAFVEAFYTTAVFRLERWILQLLISRPSTDGEAYQLARGERTTFSAWSLEDRSPNQLLMCDFRSRTRSWFMVAVSEGDGANETRLYFGSVVVPVRDARTGRMGLGSTYSGLLWFHKLYSRVLLRAAARRLARSRRSS